MELSRDFKGIWIPKEIWLNKNLSLTEKCLLVEIDSLDQNGKGCFASNEYLAEFISVSKSRCACIISRLRKDGFIIDVSFDGRTRRIALAERYKVSQKQQGSITINSKADLLKTTNQSYQKQQHSIIEKNIKENNVAKLPSNNLQDKELLFKETLRPFIDKYPTEMLKAFFLYWTEPNKSGKMRFELQPTWEVSRRLANWASKDYNKTKIEPQKPKSTAQDILSERNIV